MATIFTDKQAALTELTRDRIMMARKSHLGNAQLHPDYLWGKLMSAEAEVSRRLRVKLQPTAFFPEQPSEAELAALPAGMPWEIDPAYDYDPEFFSADMWGFVITRERPVVSVSSMRFAYPAPAHTLYEIPHEWIRVDQRAGHIRVVPYTQTFAAPLGIIILQAVSAGRSIPFMVQLRYIAGLTDVATNYPEVIDVIKKTAVLRIIEDSFSPQSGSISGDGLSQSVSVDLDKYEELIDRAIHGAKGTNGGLMAAIHGIRLGVLR